VKVLTRSEIQTLANIKQTPAISILMQTNTVDYSYLREDFRYRLTKIKETISQRYSVETKDALLTNAYKLLHDRNWWAHADKTAAIYIGRDFLQAYHLADSYEEAITIASEFDIVPLLDSIADGEFHVLALSQHKVRLLWSNRHAVEEVHLDELEDAIKELRQEEAIHDRRSDYYLQTNTNPDIFKYLKLVDQIVTPYMQAASTPLVLIGLPHIVALFQSLTSYNNVVKKYVSKNPDGMNLMTVRNRAWTALKPQARRDQRLAYSQFNRLLHSQPQRIARGIKQVMDAISEGRVQTLFINTSDRQWGSLNATHAVDIHENPQPGDVNLLNMLARSAVSSGQHVFSLPDSSGEFKTAAILRS